MDSAWHHVWDRETCCCTGLALVNARMERITIPNNPQHNHQITKKNGTNNPLHKFWQLTGIISEIINYTYYCDWQGHYHWITVFFIYRVGNIWLIYVPRHSLSSGSEHGGGSMVWFKDCNCNWCVDVEQPRTKYCLMYFNLPYIHDNICFDDA